MDRRYEFILIILTASVGGLGSVGCGSSRCQSDKDCFKGERCNQETEQCVQCDGDGPPVCRASGGDIHCDGAADGSTDLPDPQVYWSFDGRDRHSHQNAASQSGEPPLRLRGTRSETTSESIKGKGIRIRSREYLTAPHDSSFELRNGTIMLWYRPSSLVGDNSTLFSKDATGYVSGGHLHVRLDHSDAGSSYALSARLQTDSDGHRIKTNVSSDAVGEWHHVAVTFGKDGFNLYHDGALVGKEQTWTVGLWSDDGNRNAEPVTVGVGRSRSPSGSFQRIRRYFDGSVDEFVVFDEQIHPGRYVERCGNAQ